MPAMRYYLLIPILFFVFPSFSASIRGRVFDVKSREPLVGAIVSIKNLQLNAQTDADGRFQLSSVKAGAYELNVEFVGYSAKTVRISVKENIDITADIALYPNTLELMGVTIYGRADKETEASSRMDEKNAANVTNIISSKTIEKLPDINAANVLQRMSGITIDRSTGGTGSYSIIRGMEPRYNNTLINGIKIASTDEKSRFVPLDIIPSDLLKRIEVSKALTPEMEADAIGGTVNLLMKDAPDSALFKASASVGYSQLFIDKKYQQFDQSGIVQKSPYETYGADYVAKPGDFTRANLKFTPEQAPPSYTAGVTLGKRFANNRWGALVSLSVQNEYSGAESEFNEIGADVNGAPQKTKVGNRDFYVQNANYGVVAHVDYIIDAKNKLNLSNVLLVSDLAQARLSIDTVLVGDGRTVPGTGFVNPLYRSFTTRQVIENLKLDGNHILAEGLTLDWRAAVSDAAKHAPDRAEIVTDFKIDNSFNHTSTFFDNITRIWQHNDDRDYSGFGDLTYLQRLFQKDIEFKGGGMYRYKSRDSREDDYILRPTADANGVKQVYTNIDAAQWIVYNPKGTISNPNDYVAHEKVSAGYLQGKTSFERLQVFAGVRVENTQQDFTIQTINITQANGVEKSYSNVLPSAHLKYSIDPAQNLRLSYFSSLSRPGYFELVPYTFLGADFNERGNPALKAATSDNIDLRYEWFPNSEDQLLVGGFYKKIKNAIEYEYSDFGGGTVTYTPKNLGDAANRGIELVFVKYFNHFGLSGNYTYTASTISSPKILNDVANNKTTYPLQERSLQGQTAHIANLSVLFREKNSGLFAQLVLGYVGRTLRGVSPYYGYDYYSRPQTTLALSVEKRVSRHFIAFGKFNNLLNTPSEVEISNYGLLQQRDIHKASYQVGLNFTY